MESKTRTVTGPPMSYCLVRSYTLQTQPVASANRRPLGSISFGPRISVRVLLCMPKDPAPLGPPLKRTWVNGTPDSSPCSGTDATPDSPRASAIDKGNATPAVSGFLDVSNAMTTARSPGIGYQWEVNPSLRGFTQYLLAFSARKRTLRALREFHQRRCVVHAARFERPALLATPSFQEQSHGRFSQ